jgi:hypothetical protein
MTIFNISTGDRIFMGPAFKAVAANSCDYAHADARLGQGVIKLDFINAGDVVRTYYLAEEFQVVADKLKLKVVDKGLAVNPEYVMNVTERTSQKGNTICINFDAKKSQGDFTVYEGKGSVSSATYPPLYLGPDATLEGVHAALES